MNERRCRIGRAFPLLGGVSVLAAVVETGNSVRAAEALGLRPAAVSCASGETGGARWRASARPDAALSVAHRRRSPLPCPGGTFAESTAEKELVGS